MVRGRFLISGETVLKNGCVVVEGDRIVDVGPFDEMRKRYGCDVVLGDEWKVVAPGLINCHYHSREQLAQTLFPDGLGEEEWFSRYCLPYHEALGPDEERLAFQLALYSMALNGITAFADGGIVYPSTTLEALEAIPLRCFTSTWCWDVPETLHRTVDEALYELEQLYQTFHGRMNGLLRVCATPISTETCSEELLEEVFSWSRNKGLKTHIHAASFIEEFNRSVVKRGKAPVEYLAEKRLLNKDTVLLHAIHLSENDVKLIGDSGAAAVCCPMSALTKGKGLALKGKYPELLRNGVRVGLGADGAPSSHHTDMLRLAALFAGIFRDARMDAKAVSAVEAWNAATSTAASVLGIDHETGSLEKGKKADIILLDLRRPAFTPSSDILKSLVFSATGDSVDTVIVNGRVVVYHREIKGFDCEKVYEYACEAVSNLERNLAC
ncbi:MAG: amidohydrolase family protein [Candidatus Caldarchaeum sp.]|nr:amidohydrolase family protein [Candidatus Caldarchaeum sp.]MDW7978885.1 amidohydrolase family protein [Candidatus Caldarchaeum sp.]